MTRTRFFWRNLILFILPFALPFILYTGGLIALGESMPLSMVVALQSGDTPVLYRPQFGNRDLEFKTLSVNTRKPQIIAVGSSRVLQLRGAMFTERQNAFYNAGAPAWQLAQVTELLRSLDADTLPKIVLFGIDAPWFNDSYEGDTFPAVTNDFAHIFSVNRSIAQAALDGKAFDLSKLFARYDTYSGSLALGIKAIENGHGFRNDGSEQYGDFLVGRFLSQPIERERHLEWMRKGEEMYVYGDTVSASTLRDLDALLQWCAERGIVVIGFMPPYAPTLYERMLKRDNHPYIERLSDDLAVRFAAYNFAYLDFSDGAAFGTDRDFYDGWHGSERVYLRLFMQMLERQPQVLEDYANVERLRQIDAQVTDTWRVFDR